MPWDIDGPTRSCSKTQMLVNFRPAATYPIGMHVAVLVRDAANAAASIIAS